MDVLPTAPDRAGALEDLMPVLEQLAGRAEDLLLGHRAQDPDPLESLPEDVALRLRIAYERILATVRAVVDPVRAHATVPPPLIVVDDDDVVRHVSLPLVHLLTGGTCLRSPQDFAPDRWLGTEDTARFQAVVAGARDGAPAPARAVPVPRPRTGPGATVHVSAFDGSVVGLDLSAARTDWVVAGDRVPVTVVAARPLVPAPGLDTDGPASGVDQLTGLLVRAGVLRHASSLRHAAPDAAYAFVSVTVLGLREVTAGHGHAVSNEVLLEVAPRLRAILRPGDVLGRSGGDEFVVLLPGAAAEGARQVAERVAEHLARPFTALGATVTLHPHVGVACQPDPGALPGADAPPDQVLRHAEEARVTAVSSGRPVVVHSAGPARPAAAGQRELLDDVRRGLEASEFVPYYQPVVDVLEGRLAGVEALVRWQHPDRGVLPPGAFIDAVEDSDLIVPMSRTVLDKAVAQAAAWRRAGYEVETSVNLSPGWLERDDVPTRVGAVLKRHGLPSTHLRLEITETVEFGNRTDALDKLRALRDLGVGLALDDFGTGYASMEKVSSLPVDELKIDRRFVAGMRTSTADAVIVELAVKLGRQLGHHVVAEGIEDADTLTELVALGCHLAQGYHFAKPMPAADLLAWAREQFGETWRTGLAGPR